MGPHLIGQPGAHGLEDPQIGIAIAGDKRLPHVARGGGVHIQYQQGESQEKYKASNENHLAFIWRLYETKFSFFYMVSDAPLGVLIRHH